MNTRISDTTPLLGLVFAYLRHSDVQRWRLSGRSARDVSNGHIAPVQWKDIVLAQSILSLCHIYPRLYLLQKMFHCTVCRKYTCEKHVMSRNREMCEKCVFNTGSHQAWLQ